MAAAVDAGRASYNGSTAATSHSVSMPASISAGDVLVSVVRAPADPGTVTYTGWTAMFDGGVAYDGANGDRMLLLVKVAVGGDSLTFTATNSVKLAAVTWRLTGAYQFASGSPTDTFDVASVTGSSTTPNPPNGTTPWGSEDVLWMWIGGWEGEQTSPPASQPTGYSNPAGGDTGTAGAVAANCRVAGATKGTTGSTAEDPGTWTISASDNWTALTVGVRPYPTQKAGTDSGSGSDSSALAVALPVTDTGGVALGTTDTGFVAPTSGATVDTGTPAWVNPGNILSDDATVATVSVGLGETSDSLYASGFGLALGGAPVGFEVEVDLVGPGIASTVNAFLTKNGTAVAGDARQCSGIGLNTLGGPTDMWGATVSEAEAESSTFGVFVVCFEDTGTTTTRVDYVKLKVYYSGGAAGEVAVTASDSSAKAGTDASGTTTDTSTEVVDLPRTDSGTDTETSALATAIPGTDSGAGAETWVVDLYGVDAGSGAETSALEVALAVTDTGSGAETSTLVAEYATTDTGAGSDASTLVYLLALTDTGSGAEVSTLTVDLPLTDTGSAADSATDFTRDGISDSGAGSDASTLSAAFVVTESVTGADTGIVGVADIPTTESGTGADASTLEAVYATTDSGSGSEVSALAAAYSLTDSGSGVDTSSLLTEDPNKVAADSGSGVDASTLVVDLPRTETGSGADTSALEYLLALTDTGAGTDASALVAVYGLDEAGSDTEISALIVDLPQTDNGAGTEAVTDRAIALTEDGAGTDASTLVVAHALTDSAAGVEASALVVGLSVTETGTGADSSVLEAVYAVTDTGAGTEVSDVFTGTTDVVASDSGAGSEVVAALSLRVGDIGGSSDTNYGTTITSYNDYPRQVRQVAGGNEDWTNAESWAVNDQFPYGTTYAEVVLPPYAASDYLQVEDFPFWDPVWPDPYPNGQDVPYLAVLTARLYTVEGTGVSIETRLKPATGSVGNYLSHTVSNTAATFVTLGEALIVGPPRDGYPNVWNAPSVTANPGESDHPKFGFELQAYNNVNATRTLRIEVVQAYIEVYTQNREVGALQFVGVDSGSGTDSAVVTVPVAASDSGSATETSTLAAAFNDRDIGTGFASNPIDYGPQEDGFSFVGNSDWGAYTEWSNATVAALTSPDTNKATVSIGANTISEDLQVLDWGITARGARATRVYVEADVVVPQDSTTPSEATFWIQLTTDGGATAAKSSQISGPISDRITTWWAVNLTEAEVESADFGVLFFLDSPAGEGASAEVGYVRLGVTYEQEVATVSTVASGTDSGTGADAAAVSVQLDLTDTGTGVELISGLGIVTTDEGVGTESLGPRTFGAVELISGLDSADANWWLIGAPEDSSLALTATSAGAETLTPVALGTQTLTPATLATETLTAVSSDNAQTLNPIDYEPQ